ncbi:MAG: hypothetical protein GX325_03995 [Peptococcaceae bacterium]|nr:hypothetical protein [Peptococcaceae bacterium]
MRCLLLIQPEGEKGRGRGTMDKHKVETLKKLSRRRVIFENYIALVKKQVSNRNGKAGNKGT